MNETLFGYVSTYGLPVVAVAAYLSCLAIPIPTSAVMLAAGAFAAAGDLILWQVVTLAWLAAVLGDQTGFFIGRKGGARIIEILEAHPRRAALIGNARALMQRWGGVGVFFSTWLFAPLGPWVNFLAGSAKLSWIRFTLWDIAGEAIWVGLYVSLGFQFAARLPDITTILNDWAGLISAAVVTLGLALFLLHKVRASRNDNASHGR